MPFHSVHGRPSEAGHPVATDKRSLRGSLGERVQSAHLAALALLALAAVALAGAAMTVAAGAVKVVAVSTGVGVFVLLAVLALISALLEWNRLPYADRWTTASGALGTAMTLVGVVSGWWYLAPVIGIITLGVLLSLAYRLMVRDEARHSALAHSLFH